MPRDKVRVLFVCLGNICRSPMAEGIFRKTVTDAGLADVILIDSAGTHAYHVGEPPDERAQAATGRRGIDISGLRGRQATVADFASFDYVLAMDYENRENLHRLGGDNARVEMFLAYAPDCGREEVPDPYYGGPAGFELVYSLLEQAAHGLLADIRQRHLRIA
ncbi:MAG: low molecular weight phosphotyrosine protein phosphatase [Gammaproteobacteria bacterium]|nr:low molecular weight phosphotyrosine protein phosphatase [Gammaproteobacteria bacterium]